jgi:hypothetical protein
MEKTDDMKFSDILFQNLVSSLYSSAMMFLGKIMHPETGKIEKNLPAAHTNIEMLRMLKEKTSGNLSDEESRMLGDALSNMQLNYVDEMEKQEKNSGKENEKPVEKPAEEQEKKEDEK